MPRINLPISALTARTKQSLQTLKKVDLQSLRSSARTKQYSVAGIATAGAAAMALTLVPGSADAGDESQSSAAKVSSAPVAFSGPVEHADKQRNGIAQQLDSVEKQIAADKKAAEAKKEKAAAAAAKKREAKQEASRSHKRGQAEKATAPSYPNNLDGWIREARSIMAKHGIPGSYEGIHRNIMRESSGDPRAINNWDINAQNGVPSKGLLQVIKPTFDAYHVQGTPHDQYDPVANIVAACNYAADRYGTIDNVDSAY
ncbi:lytic transglycosylase [Streptomyces sp. RKND-216]|uniref:transglycosylase SLT domain-containing protein n=1 Tax=Streptomyces sp. RKND-216 TaxID=2562581 RepID=UPI00109DC066|nr:transglycosylase SLT domain-containing protein [Streptomyces sp. RKND-216]THA26849.1 lytic transglycosylase [Streptomyces sp. RKND-216]